MNGSTYRVEDKQGAMANLVRCLPKMETNAEGTIDFANCDARLLVTIATNAETAMNAIHLGVAALGSLLAYASPEVEDGSISADSVESLGWFLAEFGELASALMVLAAHCRREAGVDLRLPSGGQTGRSDQLRTEGSSRPARGAKRSVGGLARS